MTDFLREKTPKSSGSLPTQSDRDELIRKAMQALRSTGIELALRERAEVVLRAIGAIQ